MASRFLERRWINCPSTLQPYYKYNQLNGIYDKTTEVFYPVSGNIISFQVASLYTSKGWTNGSR
jgi:hypothetical protein